MKFKNYIMPIAIIGAGVAGFFIGKKIGQDEESKRVQNAINEYKESYAKRREETEQYVEEKSKKIEDVKVEEEVPQEPEVKIISENEYLKGEMLKDFKNKKVKAERKENKYSKKHIDYDPSDEYYEDELDEEGNPPGPSEGYSDPYTITYEEFATEEVHFDKKAVVYYAENDTLVYDESDECILEDVQLFGDDWREPLEENGTIYVRNEKLSTDFEIIFKEGAYVGD